MRKLMRKLSGRQAGFTLVELLVVVGIIVGLAAVIVPNVARFASKGDEGAKAAEKQNIQTAFDTYMSENNLTTVTANDLGTTGNGTNDFGATGIVNLSNYLRESTTKYYYCWSSAGLVHDQFDAAAQACTQ